MADEATGGMERMTRVKYDRLVELLREMDSVVVAFRWANTDAGAGSVRSSAGTSAAWIDVTEPFLVEVIRSCRPPISVSSVGW